MNINQIHEYFDRLFSLADFHSDPSKNGIQVANSGKKIKKVAFSVDASFSSIEQAAECKADMLFVHHGLFWGTEQPIVGIHYRRLSTLMQNDLALYACHLPLDAHAEIGNNAGLAQQLSLLYNQPFGSYRGCKIGFKGSYKKVLSLDDVVNSLPFPNKNEIKIFPFGKKNIATCGIVSGAAGDLVEQAVEENLDLFITGAFEHELYNIALENNLNVIAAGHYQTETIGIRLTEQRFYNDTGIETIFIDIPTSL